MMQTNDSDDHVDLFDLNRFILAQNRIYDRAIAEIRNGKKQTHWMWYIFPQIDGLGFSTTTKHYSLKSLQEAREYLAHPILGARLLECSECILAFEGQSISDLFGYPDDLKLRSSMTLFAHLSDTHSVFTRVLNRFFNGEPDDRTLNILEAIRKENL